MKLIPCYLYFVREICTVQYSKICEQDNHPTLLDLPFVYSLHVVCLSFGGGTFVLCFPLYTVVCFLVHSPIPLPPSLPQA